MNTGKPAGLQLTEDEAYALLELAMVSPGLLDAAASQALEKLARYCSQRRGQSIYHRADFDAGELIRAGA